MTKKDLDNWIMYHEIHKLSRIGFSASKIAHHMGVDARTVRKYLIMTEDGFEHYLLRCQQRNKLLSPYEAFVREKLTIYPDTSSAQMHDWLKERFCDLPYTSSRTVYNFVMFVRQTYNIPVIPVLRDYCPVEELPYGLQAQVDFGQYNMRYEGGKRKKVWFFTMVMSRSRMKYVCFRDTPYTAETVSLAHERAFDFYGGIPNTIVYDQDRTMVVDENIGDIILTSTFKQYTRTRSFDLHFCRKSDPESKGKVENVVQYVKKNFLYNRRYEDLENLNAEALAWLLRTANALEHNTTKKMPYDEFIIERKHLKPYTPLTIENKEVKLYHVRKTNVINFKSNFYSLPMGTYIGKGTAVIVKQSNGILNIYNLQEKLICAHPVSLQKGQLISNTDHRRDNSKSLDVMINQTVLCFSDRDAAMDYILKIKNKLPRYTRDHLQVMLKCLNLAEKEVADKTLSFCRQNKLLNGHDFEQVLFVLMNDRKPQAHSVRIKPINAGSLQKANETPEKSNIADYENIINH